MNSERIVKREDIHSMSKKLNCNMIDTWLRRILRIKATTPVSSQLSGYWLVTHTYPRVRRFRLSCMDYWNSLPLLPLFFSFTSFCPLIPLFLFLRNYSMRRISNLSLSSLRRCLMNKYNPLIIKTNIIGLH